MENHIRHLSITNFKSIRNLELSGFKKINLFIGRPNVGKSNILEALSVFSLPISKGAKLLKELKKNVRIESESELFYEGNNLSKINISINNKICSLHYLSSYATIGDLENDGSYAIIENDRPQKIVHPEKGLHLNFLAITNQKEQVYIKYYHFNPNTKFKRDGLDYLSVPFGENMLQILEVLPHLREVYANWFEQYGLRLVLDKASNSLKIMKDKGKEVFIIPYSLIADTLQRIIFYKTAVASNEHSVLLFEEPEAHAFPPYIAEFTQEVIKSQTNQFMIVTHSPIIVNDFLENAREDLAIFMVDFKDGQTVAHPLSDNEIYEVYKYGVDLFFNNEAYLNA